ncbi:MAG TPA: hypothetical protein DCS55_05140 [Acidimicrobiaceae bacterium]|nr:hypothetical protein [Acidimicrobiaceae bacterium]
MATRIDIELTSRQDEGKTFTWRAAGARQPKGAADASLFPESAEVGDEFRVDTEMDVDGIRVTQVIPPKGKEPKKVETLELITRDDEPLVTEVRAERGRGRGDRGDRGPRRGGGGRDGGRGRKDGDRGPRGEGGDRGPRGEGGRRGGNDRPRTPAKPKLPPKPKPPRLKAGKAHRNALIDSLPEEQKAVAQELLRGGLQAVRTGLEKQNEQRKVEGQDPIDEGPIVTLAEELLVKVRAAEWRDRAEAALEQSETVDLRDLRSVVTASDGAAKDDETRALAAKVRTALNERLDADQQAWVAEVVEMLDDDRVVRALHLSSRPPKAGAPLPAPVALRLVEAANASMSSETSPDRWSYILEALAHSPVRRQVVPVSLPGTVSDELKATIARHGSRLPEIAQIFGVEPDPKAGRDANRRKRRSGGKPKKDAKPGDAKADQPKADESKAEEPKVDEPKAEEPQVEEQAVPEAVEQAPTEAPAPEIPAAEALEAEQATADGGSSDDAGEDTTS